MGTSSRRKNKSSSASSMLRACSARELLKFLRTAIRQSTSHPVLDELPTHAISTDRRSALALGVGVAAWTPNPKQWKVPEMAPSTGAMPLRDW